MPETEAFSRLVTEIYDAALDPALWCGVLGKLAGFAGGQSAGLGSFDQVSRDLNVCYTFGCDPDYLRLQVDIYAKYDPTAALHHFPPEQVASIADIMPYDDYRDTRFYREWAAPQGWVDSANAVLDKSPTAFALFSVYRHETSGLVDDDMRRRMRLIVSHVRRAAMIGKAIEFKTAAAATFADTLDGLSTAMFLVDAKARIVHSNSSGRDMLREGHILHSQQDTLAAIDPQAGQALRDAIATAGGGDAAISANGAAISLSSRPDEHWLAYVLPLASGARQRAGIAYAAVAAVFVRRAAPKTQTPTETIAKLYRLTPSELRVLDAVVDLGGVSAVADALGVSQATVKTHLQHVFEKTGMRRQVDLVKLAAGHASPFQT